MTMHLALDLAEQAKSTIQSQTTNENHTRHYINGFYLCTSNQMANHHIVGLNTLNRVLCTYYILESDKDTGSRTLWEMATRCLKYTWMLHASDRTIINVCR
jgi:hypothetical protein